MSKKKNGANSDATSFIARKIHLSLDLRHETKISEILGSKLNIKIYLLIDLPLNTQQIFIRCKPAFYFFSDYFVTFLLFIDFVV